jgi:hypothetical protein
MIIGTTLVNVTREELSAAFDAWLVDAQTNPDNFLQQNEFKGDSYGTECADYLIGALKAAQ